MTPRTPSFFVPHWSPTDPDDIVVSKAQDVMDDVLIKHPGVRRFDPKWANPRPFREWTADIEWEAGYVPWMCNFESKYHTLGWVSRKSNFALRQLSKDVVTLLRHRARHTPVQVDGGGWANIGEVASSASASRRLSTLRA